MKEMYNYDAQKKKLQGVCDENGLVFSFSSNTYPITLTIKPLEKAQMSLFDEQKDQSPEAYISFSYVDGDIEITTSDTFTLSEVLFTKIKNIFKKMYFYWVQHFFRTVVEKELIGQQIFDEIAGEAEECDGLPEGAEPLLEDDLEDIEEELDETLDDVLDDEELEGGEDASKG